MTFPETDRPAGALVLGGEYRGLGVVRSLGRQGIPVWVLTDDNRIAAMSRYSRRSIPWPRTGDREKLLFLQTLAGKERLYGWTLFPTNDEDAAFIARNNTVLAQLYRLTTPAWDKICWAYDKRLTLELAQRAGVDHPWTFCPRSRDDVARIDRSGPLILKPAVKVGFNAFTHAKAWKTRNRADLLARYDAACQLVDPTVIMVQEIIPGGGEDQFSYAALCRDGKPLATLTARRLRQYPVDFGRASTFVESIEDADVEKCSEHLLAEMDYTGLIEIEYKRDPRNGRYMLLDLNPRVWGWHSIGHLAGVDFPFLQWKAAHDEEIPWTRGRPNVRWVRFSTDILAFAHALRHGNLTIFEYAKSLRQPLGYAILATDDLAPAAFDIPLLVLHALKRGAV